MLIRSQNKEVIINFDNLKTVRIGGYSGDSIIVFTESEALEIGKYSTEEKAIKVLDMICDHNFWYQDVFQMPQDDEVTI